MKFNIKTAVNEEVKPTAIVDDWNSFSEKATRDLTDIKKLL